MLVIGHRGASGYRPENTLASYELAFRLGADRVEPDIVPTADGALVLRHESELSRSTDIATRPELAAAMRTRTVLGEEVTGWFTEDLTLEQVRSVRAVEPHPELRQAPTVYDGLYPVPELHELVALTERLRLELGRPLTITAEVKDPARFARDGHDVAAMLVAELSACGVDLWNPRTKNPPFALQCFDPRFLRRLRQLGVRIPLVQLVAPFPDGLADEGYPDGAALCTPSGLAEVASYAQVLATHKDMVLPVGADGALGPVTPLVVDAHAAGLEVHVWTLRNESCYLAPALRSLASGSSHGRALAEHLAFARAGVDGIFTDHPDTGVEARRLWLERREAPVLVR